MTTIIETLLVVIVVATFTGGIGGALAAWAFLRRAQRRQPNGPPVPSPDPTLDGEIQRAAEAWANAQGRPEASRLMADKLHVLHRIGRKRGWWR